MRRHLYSILLTLTALIAAGTAKASHLYGVDFFYEYVSGYTYKVTLVIYGDCSGASFPNLLNAQPQVQLLNNSSVLSTFSLSQSGPGVEVTPVCPALANSTACANPTNPIPGVTRYIYNANLTLPYPYQSANWEFKFTGNMPVSGSSTQAQAGRSNSITNIQFVNMGGSVTVMTARLNNTLGANSSPQFTTLPTPFYCVNVAQQYNQGAVDADNDSLTYALVAGQEPNNGIVTYQPGYSAAAPLATTTGSFSFSPATGQLSFTPSIVQKSLVVQQVNEYRQGVLVGTASREMTFVVLNNCTNTPASSNIDTSKASIQNGGSVVVAPTEVNVCQGADSIRFSIIPNNPGGDTITASASGLPTGSSVSIVQNDTKNPIVTFIWKNPSLAPGNYSFYITYKDHGCPLSSQQTQAYTIHVYRPNEMSSVVLAPTQCQHQALVGYNFAYGLAPRSITITQGGNLVKSFRDTTGAKRDSLGAGVYTVTIKSDKLLCPSIYSLRITDSGIYPHAPVAPTQYYCKYAPSVAVVAIPDSGGIIKWYAANGTPLNYAPIPRTDTAGIFTWYVNQRVKVCESLRDSVKVYVTLRPIAGISGPKKICLNDTAVFSFNGTIGVGPILEYHWNFDSAGYVSGDSAGPIRVHWYDTGTKVIVLRVDENKCPSLPVYDTLVVKPIPYAGFFIRDVCQHDTAGVFYSTEPRSGQQYTWTFTGADMTTATGLSPQAPRWDSVGKYLVTLTVNLDGCTDTRSRQLEVFPAPIPRILNAPGPVCIGDNIDLAAEGGGSYNWQSGDPMIPTATGPLYHFRILKPETIHVTVTTAFGCSDSTSITYNDVQPCCNFSYPDAFTPNNDGRNDRFHIIAYGNQLEYELSIYNRWGQRVYYGLDPKQGWDGTYGGKLCDAGTYYYYLNAKCYTGRQETHKGELTLVR